MVIQNKLKTIFFSTILCIILVCLYIAFKNIALKNALQELLPRPKKLDVQKCQKICTSKQCIKTSGYILEYMKSNVDPCQDFFNFTCGNYFDKKYPSYETKGVFIFPESQYKLYLDVKNMLNNYNDNENRPLYRIIHEIKKVFNLCMNRKFSNGKEEDGLFNIFKKIGLQGWPHFEQNWTIPTMDLDKFLARIKLIGEYSFLSFDFDEPEDKENKTFIKDPMNPDLELVPFKFEQEKLILREGKYRDTNNTEILEEISEYKRMIKQIFMLFNFNENDSEKISEEIWHFEKGIANLPSENSDISQTINCNCSQQAINRKCNWCNFMQYYFDYYNIDISLIEICSDNILRVENLRTYISETSPRILANYIGLRLTMKHIPEINKIFYQLLSNNSVYKKILERNNIFDERKRLEFCGEWIGKRFQYPLAMVYVEKNFKETMLEMLKESYNYVKNTSLLVTDEMLWLDEGYKNCTKTEIASSRLRSRAFSLMYNASDIKQIYSDLHFNADTFIENSVEYNAFVERCNIRFAVKRNLFRYFPYSSMFRDVIFNANFYYDFAKNVDVDLGVLRFPFFAPQRPFHLNMGTGGVFLAHELGHAFKFAMESCDIGSNESFHRYSSIAKCLKKDYSNFKKEFKDIFVQDVNQSINEDFADNFAVYVSHKILTKYAEEHQIQPLPGLQMSHNKLFLILFSQLFCEAAKKEFYEIYREASYSPNKLRAFVPLRHTQFFADTFKCPLHTTMNTQNKCNFFV